MASLVSVRLNKGDSSSWGFRLQGGKDFGTPLVVQKVIGGSPAERAGLLAGDTVVKINNIDVYNLRHKDAQDVILRAGPSFEIAVQRGGSTWKPSVVPVGSVPSPRVAAPLSNVSPVTATSLAAGRQENIGAIGTSHNLSAKPFGVNQVNGGPKFVNKQYNSPLPLYSEQSIAETLSAQSEVLSNGVLGVNFKKNEKSYDAANSEVFRMVQEADKEPRDYDAEPETSGSGVVTAPLGIVGLRHVQAPENKPTPPTQQLPPGQNICADCERLIVGVFVRIKDKNLHVECFKCSTCGTSLKNVGYYNLNNKLYCDVHAKLAARNNPPAPNLQPITVPPGGKIPAGAISAALASHPLPSSAPLSPSTNFSAAPYQSGVGFASPRPFSSVNASPQSTIPKLSPVPASTTPIADARGVHNIVWPPPHSEPELPTASPLYFPPPSQVQSRIKQLKESEHVEEQDYCELEEMNYLTQHADRNMSLCSTEVSSITGRRSRMECSETISDTIDTQILVESILQTKSSPPRPPPRPKSPPPVPRPKSPPPPDVSVTFTISEAQLRRGKYVNTLSNSTTCNTTQSYESKGCSLKETKQSQNLASMYEKKIKVENTVPHKWESPMLVALTVAPDKPYTQSEKETIEIESERISSDVFSQIPEKRSTSAFASALSTAPPEPFTPITSASLEPVSLPEETMPYFPPEHPIISEQVTSKESGKSYTKKKTREEDPLLKDLPKPPPEKISLLSALTTAPDRPYSPLTIETPSYHTESLEKDIAEVKKESKTQQLKTSATKNYLTYSPTSTYTAYTTGVLETDYSKSKKGSKSEKTQKTVDVKSSEQLKRSGLITKNTTTAENLTTGQPPMIQLVRSTYETKTDKVQMEMSCQFAGEPVVRREIIKKTSMQDVQQEESVKKSLEESRQMSEVSQRQRMVKAAESVSAAKCALASRSAVSSETDAASVSESALLQKAVSESRSSAEATQKVASGHATVGDSRIQSKQAITAQKAVADSRSAMEATKTIKQTEESCLQAKYVAAVQTATKERVKVIQPGQTNLSVPQISFQPVADDVCPNTTFSPRPRSLSPSMINKPAPVIPPYQASLVAVQCPPVETNVFDPTSPNISRSPSPYGGRPSSPFPSSVGRAPSPAPGPPPNPLQPHKSTTQLLQEGRKQDARSHLQTYIPQYQAKSESIRLADYRGQSKSAAQQVVVAGNASQKSVSQASVSETQRKRQELSREMANLKSETVQTSSDGSVQIQRKKRVSEEYEHTQRSVEVEKFSSGSQVRSALATSGGDQVSVSFHITNPQPLKSTFLSSAAAVTDTTVETSASQSTQSECSKKSTAALKSGPPSASSLPLAAASSTVNLSKPNVSQPNVGTGGGRQAGAVGVAPKRGRGILNLAATPGSRVPLCAQCHSNIRGPFITALGKIWCPEHFICATPSCRRQLQDLGFVEERGQLYCEYCFEQYLAPTCSKCNTKVKGDCLKAIGKNFHPECFNCVYCGKLFGNSPFFLEDGQPYCEGDWNELFTTKCFACGFPVEAGDRWVEALNNNYHSQCFNCTMCKKNLEGQSFFAKGGRPFCKNHAR